MNHPDRATTAAAAPDTRDGNKDKFAWFYAMMADPTVSIKAKAIGAACIVKWAGRKGYFKATHKAIAQLCATSQTTVRRALADLIDLRYLTVELGQRSGAANTYTLKLPAQRYEEWLKAEDEYRRVIERWLYTEKKWRDEHAENQFRRAVLVASVNRGAEFYCAQRFAAELVREYRAKGLELDIEQGLKWVAISKQELFTPAEPAAEKPRGCDHPDTAQKRAAPCSPGSSPLSNTGQPPAQGSAAPCSPLGSTLLTPDAPTTVNGQTHKSFKDSERPGKVFQELESEPALRNALNARPPRGSAEGPAGRNTEACALCDGDGIFRGRDGYPVVLLDDNDKEYPVECQHSMAANLAHIQSREEAEDRGVSRTGWPGIDSHYPEFDGPTPDEL